MSSMKELQPLVGALWVGAGGFFGAAARYLVVSWVSRKELQYFPFGTLTVNLVGCLLIGIVAGLGDARGFLGTHGRLFVVVGVLGGFTTYSTFALDALSLGYEGELERSLVYVGLHLVAGLGFAWLGYRLGRLA